MGIKVMKVAISKVDNPTSKPDGIQLLFHMIVKILFFNGILLSKLHLMILFFIIMSEINV